MQTFTRGERGVSVTKVASSQALALILVALSGCPEPVPRADGSTIGGATQFDASGVDAAFADATATDTAAPDSAAADALAHDATATDSTHLDSTSNDAAAAGPFVVRGASQRYHVTTTVTVHNNNATLTRLSVLLPAPETNAYQDVDNLDVGSGSLRSIPATDDHYVLFSQTSGLPTAGTSASYAVSYDVTLYDLHSDLAQVTAIQPYDVASDAYRWYTGASGVYVVPDNATIQSISSTLWSAHPDIVSYARAAYDYVAANYSYLNPYTGLHPLADLLAAGGGDCGNLSSIFISLLRARSIPARHLVTMRPDGSAHVWADFLLQGYGWVPVDVTYQQANPGGDFFGRVALASNGIIENKEVALQLDNGDGTLELALLQTYGWWYWVSTSASAVTSAYDITAVPR